MLEDYKRAWSQTDQGVPAPAAHHGRRGGGGRVLQRQGVRHPDQRELRAQEAVPRRHRPLHRRDGHRDVLERAQQDLQRHARRRWSRSSREERYVGYIDVNCIVNSNGIYPLEFTARFGYPTISIQQEGMLTPIGELLVQAGRGLDHARFKGQERLPGRRADRGAALPVQRPGDLREQLQGRGDHLQDAEPRGRPHRGREDGQRRVAGDRHLGRGADRVRHRARP